MKTVLITGGTRGIGKAMSQLFHQENYKVAALYHHDDVSAQELHNQTGIPVFKWDISCFKACQEGVAQVEHALGRPIDVLVNNAGMTQDSLFHKMEPHQWEKVLVTNLFAVFSMTRAVINQMIERKEGCIVNISSINGVKGQRGQTNYSASKAGLIGFTKSLAQEVAAHGISVNAIAPGYIATEMVQKIKPSVLETITQAIPLKRLGSPEEVARMALFLASSHATFITGATFHINGGQLMD